MFELKYTKLDDRTALKINGGSIFGAQSVKVAVNSDGERYIELLSEKPCCEEGRETEEGVTEFIFNFDNRFVDDDLRKEVEKAISIVDEYKNNHPHVVVNTKVEVR